MIICAYNNNPISAVEVLKERAKLLRKLFIQQMKIPHPLAIRLLLLLQKNMLPLGKRAMVITYRNSLN